MTYTLAGMEVPKFVHALIRKLLLEAGYDHAVDDREGVLDMTHIGLTAAEGPDALDEMRAAKDGAYLERNRVVAALACCFPAGVARTAIEGWDPEWENCVYIDLPTGQVSWHFHDNHAHLFARLPRYAGTWDGHDTSEKYRRLAELHARPLPDLSAAKVMGAIADLAMIVKRLVADVQASNHANIAGDSARLMRAAQAMDYLARTGLAGTPLRDRIPDGPLPTAYVGTRDALRLICKAGCFNGARFVVDPALGPDEMAVVDGMERRIYRLDLANETVHLLRTELDAGGAASPVVAPSL